MIGKSTLTRIVIVTAIVAVVSLAIAGVAGFTAGGFDPRQGGFRQGNSGVSRCGAAGAELVLSAA